MTSTQRNTGETLRAVCEVFFIGFPAEGAPRRKYKRILDL